MARPKLPAGARCRARLAAMPRTPARMEDMAATNIPSVTKPAPSADVNQVSRRPRDGLDATRGNIGVSEPSISGGFGRPMMTRTARIASEAVILASTSAETPAWGGLRCCFLMGKRCQLDVGDAFASDRAAGSSVTT